MIVGIALETVFGIPRFWVGLIAAIIGVLFWIVGIAVLNWIFERYLKEADTAYQE